ncbi:MAG: hypothetical protein WKF84_14875 [Pyrinomonadaceae bacterium]
MVKPMAGGFASSRAVRWLCCVVVLWLSITVWCLPFAVGQQVMSAPEADSAQPERRESHLNVFDEVWQIVRDHYYDPSLHNIDWVALRGTLRRFGCSGPIIR